MDFSSNCNVSSFLHVSLKSFFSFTLITPSFIRNSIALQILFQKWCLRPTIPQYFHPFWNSIRIFSCFRNTNLNYSIFYQKLNCINKFYFRMVSSPHHPAVFFTQSGICLSASIFEIDPSSPIIRSKRRKNFI